jgi:hypothetical protein
MPIATAAILEDGVVATTGGTSKSLTVLGTNLEETDVYWGGTTFADRLSATFSTKQPKLSSTSPGGYTQGRAKVIFRTPKTLANGAVTVNTMTIEFAFDPQTTDAEKARILSYASQLISDSDFPNFWKSLSVT